MNYYPFGAEFCDGSTKNYDQKRKYNGKEFDNMHGLNTYDYGARQYNPVTARWDRMDPLAEKYSGVSPYVYCVNNPIKYIDPDGRDVLIWYKDKQGNNNLFRFSGFHGNNTIKIPNNPYIKDFMKAYLYNAKYKGSKTVEAVTNHKYTIYLSDSEYYETYYRGNKEQPTVYWVPRQGLKTTEGENMSPATLLEHEMSHAIDDADNHTLHTERTNTPDEQYGNKEEMRVITEERKIAKSRGEGTRYNHKGYDIQTVSPTSTREIEYK